jgi:hypothetical protein
MANAVYAKAKEGFIAGEIDLNNAVIKTALVRGYTPNIATHKFVSDVTGAGGSLVVTSAAMTSITVTDGIFDAADITFAAVAAGAAIQHILIFQSSAVTGGADVATSAQRVICFMDTSSGVTLPITPNGADIIITWDVGTNRIFSF